MTTYTYCDVFPNGMINHWGDNRGTVQAKGLKSAAKLVCKIVGGSVEPGGNNVYASNGSTVAVFKG